MRIRKMKGERERRRERERVVLGESYSGLTDN